MSLSLYSFQRFLINCFVFFGPLGVLLSPSFLPYAFRFYHFFLLFSPFLLLQLKVSEWKALLTFIPFLLYCLISAYFTENKSVCPDAYPFFRAGLLTMQYLFMFGATFCLQNTFLAQEKARLLRLYLTSFFISLVVGYLLFFGYYAGFVPMSVLSRLCVEAQMGWGILRFSPGSYPNEYGNASSFVLSVLILLLAERKNFSLFLYLFICLTFIALILATTRTAYFSFAITFFYLCFVSKQVRQLSLKLIFMGSIVVIIMKSYSFNFLYIFFEGIKKISLTTGSSAARITEWIKGFNQLGNSAFFGTGFGSNISTHNIYLELLYEVGIIGFMLLLVSLIYYLSENHLQLRKIFFNKAMDKNDILYNRITIIGLIHVTLFAITNHNMHHHLTWMTFLFFNISLFSQKKASFPEAQRDDAFHRDDKRRFALCFLR